MRIPVEYLYKCAAAVVYLKYLLTRIPVSYSFYIISSYPAVEDELKAKLGNKVRDLFQQDTKSKEMYAKSKASDRLRISNDIKDLLYANENPDPDEEEMFINKKEGVIKSFSKRIFGYGKDDQNLSFIYLAKR